MLLKSLTAWKGRIGTISGSRILQKTKFKILKQRNLVFDSGMLRTVLRAQLVSGLRKGLIGILFVLMFGTAGYYLIEGWAWLDALYMTVITVSTVGLAEVHPLSNAGRIFTMI